MDERQQRIADAVDALRPDLVETLHRFIQIPTVNPPGERYETFVGEMGRLLRGLGYQVETVLVPADQLATLAPHGDGLPRPNLVARLEQGDGPAVCLNGHYDVVPAGHDWAHDPFGGDVEDGRVYGRGAADQKSGLVSQIFAVEALRRSGVAWQGRIVQTAVPDEETVGNRNAGTGYLVEQGVIGRGNTDAVVITEPFAPDGIGIGHKGAIWGRITVFGKQAHGSSPLLGINAIDAMARFLARVQRDLQPRLAQRVTDLGVTPPESIHSTLVFDTIAGGSAPNTVPARCTATFNRRLLPSETVTEARDELLGLLEAQRGEDPNFRYEYTETYTTEPVLVPASTPLVRTAERVISRLGMTPRLLISAGSDDQRFIVNGAGIDNCIIYGPGTTGLSHMSDEYITIDDLVLATKGLALILGEVLNGSADP